MTAGVIDTGGKFSNGVNDAGGIQFFAVDIDTGGANCVLIYCKIILIALM
jgi:hypothetical protein